VEENINLSTWVRGKGEIFSYENIFAIFPKIKDFLTGKG
jgi:ABC-type branched-subunit amino acid transport system ATPase component